MINTLSPDAVILDTIREERPLVLLLGQDAWKNDGVSDPVLELVFSHLHRNREKINGWPSLLATEPLPRDFYQWLAERFTRRVPPQWIETILSLPWSAIFTSSLDPSLGAMLTTAGKSPQIVLTGEEVPQAMRSRVRTPIYYLFGRAGQDEENSRPPSSVQALRTRRNLHAIPMLNRIAETATEIGTVIIDGFNPDSDWLKLEDVLPVAYKMPDCQFIWFGWSSLDKKISPESNEIEALVANKKILVTKSRLSSLIAELNACGKLDDVSKYLIGERGDITFENNKVFSPSPEIRIRVESVASIVDDSWVSFLPPLGEDASYSLFRRFHGDIGGSNILVEGIRRDFAIERDFEKVLWDVVSKGSKEHEKLNKPIILHGQSGTGKSIALARLVCRLKKEGKTAILYSTSRIPQSIDVSEFCELAEHNGATSSVIICDSNAHPSRYRELLQQLRSRGRKVTVVGSSYRQIDYGNISNKYLIEAPSALSESERKDFANLLNSFGAVASPENISDSSNVLAALYRMLPASRAKFAYGLGREAQIMESELRERGGVKLEQEITSPLAKALIEAGLADYKKTFLNQSLENSLENIEDSAGRLIDFVMAPGCINCPVPINLLVRAVSSTQEKVSLNIIAQMFKGIDLFRWRRSEHEGEEFLVSPRLQLEADLICRRRLGNAQMHGKRLVELLEAARLSWDAGGTERRFLIDLIQKFGPDGPKGDFYKDSYLLAARALTKLRQRYSVFEPSIMLQESALRRAAIKLYAVEEIEQTHILEEARETVQLAIEHLKKNRFIGSLRSLNNLMVERASIYGFLARNCLKKACTNQEIWSAYTAARTVVQAATNSIDAYYPLDISLWVPADLLEAEILSEQQKADLRADIHSVLDRIDLENLEYEEKAKFEQRRMKLGELLQIRDLSDEAFASLDNMGSTAGFFLRARSLGPAVGYNASDKVTSEDIKKADRVVDFFIDSWKKINTDIRCLRYLLQCKWISVTHRHLFRGERQPIPFEDDQRRKILYILQALITASGENCDYAFRYLEAVLTWLLGDEGQAKHLWINLSRDTDNNDPRRIYKHHILTSHDGSAQLFSGRVEREQAEGRWVVNVNDLNRRVFMRQDDFPEFDLAYGRSVAGFAIGFNYIGPIADSPKRAKV